MQTVVDAIQTTLAEAIGAVLTILVAVLVGWLKGKNNGRSQHPPIDRE